MAKKEVVSKYLMRLPEELKLRGEAAAQDRGMSFNKLLLGALKRELEGGPPLPRPKPKSDITSRTAGVPEIAGLVPASQLKPPAETDCRHTSALVHRGGGRYSCRKCGEVIQK